MGKVVKSRQQQRRNTNHRDNPNRITKQNAVKRRQHSQSQAKFTKAKIDSSQVRLTQRSSDGNLPASSKQQASTKVLFQKHDHVLLVGEGDFSFTSSLARYHRVKHIVATSYDTQQVLEEKYPDVNVTLAQLRRSTFQDGKHQTISETVTSDDEWNGFSESSPGESYGHLHQDSNAENTKKLTNLTVLHGIDATKLMSSHKKILRQHSHFTKIVFNFPHIGGISTDVNRQVRSNQQLLVGFFNEAKSLLASTSNPATLRNAPANGDTWATSDEEEEEVENDTKSALLTTGYIMVTLFEGEPYTLWNIRDLARHCGLKVVESFKFPWAAFPGYKHARTIGEIKTGKDRTEEGKRKGAWRGEERSARCYMLALKDADGPYPAAGSGKKRRKTNGDERD